MAGFFLDNFWEIFCKFLVGLYRLAIETLSLSILDHDKLDFATLF